MINSVSLTGRLTKDVELKYTNSGTPVASFNLAVNRSFANAQGEYEADFILCQAWRKTAEIMANNLKKGSLIGVEGRIQTRNYDGNDGKRVYVTEVVAERIAFLEPKNTQNGQNNQNQGQNYGQRNQGHNQPNNQYQQNNTAPTNQGFNQPSNQNNDPFSSLSDSSIDISDEDLPF